MVRRKDKEMAHPEQLTEAAFVAQYADVAVKHDDLQITLAQYVAFEAVFCPKSEADRQDETKRLEHLAQKLGRHLLPEHAHLLPVEK